MKRWKDALVFLIIALILISTSVQTKAAASSEGDVAWSLRDGILTISGTGPMEDYSNTKHAPWYSRREEITDLVVEEGITAIGENSFWGCSALSNVTLPATLTKIGPGAFSRCSALTDMVIPEGVTVLEQGVFGWCEALDTVTLHDGITTIEKDAFSRCYNLKHITLPIGLEEIGKHAFFGCVRLEQLNFPASIAGIGSAAFYGCDRLSSLRFGGKAPLFSENAFLGLHASVYYNRDDESWHSAVSQSYGGNIAWVAECFHQYTMTFTPPSCEKEGYSTYTCALCGDRYDNLYVPALGHTPGEGVRENETATGYDAVVYCTACGGELSREYVQIYLPGDINGDGKVNNKDASRLFQYLSDWDVTVVEAALDVNGDGKVNNKDATRLFQYLSGWNVEIH